MGAKKVDPNTLSIIAPIIAIPQRILIRRMLSSLDEDFGTLFYIRVYVYTYNNLDLR